MKPVKTRTAIHRAAMREAGYVRMELWVPPHMAPAIRHAAEKLGAHRAVATKRRVIG